MRIGSIGRLRHSAAVGGLAAAFLFAAAPASAQAVDEPDAAAEGQGGAGVQDIIVTAQRFEQSLQSVPVSVTPLSGDQLESMKLNNVNQLAIAVPSLQVGQSNYFAIRGVGTLALSSLLDQSVGVALDDVSLGVPGLMANRLLDDVDQVEVLTGPQGLLFGRNASAGLINVRSKRPRIGEASGDLYTELNYRDSLPFSSAGFLVRATANVPVAETAALRVNLSDFYQDPIVKRLGVSNGKQYDHDKRLGARAKFLWEPDPRFTVYVIGDYSDQKFLPLQVSYRNFGNPTSPVAQAAAALGIVAGPDNFYYGSDGGSFRHIKTGGVSLNLSYELSPDLSLSNIAAWRAFDVSENVDIDYSDSPISNIFSNHDSFDQYSNELRLAFNGSSFIDGQVGLYTFIQRQRRTQLLLSSRGTGIPNLVGSDVDARRKGESYAAYGQVNLHPTESLQFLLGGRLTKDHISLDSKQNFGNYLNVLFGPRNTRTVASFENTEFSYRVGAQYQFNPDIMGYATYSTGYKGPSYNQNVLAGSTPLVNPETVSSIELGFKTTLLDRRLRFNIAAFSSIFHDLQVQFRDPVGNFRIGNADKARTRGVEISGMARPVDGLSLNFGLTIQRAKFINYVGAPCYPGQGCATFNAGGLDMPNAPRFVSTVQAAYEFPLSGSTSGFLKADYYHRSPLNYLVNAEPRTRFGNVDQLGFSVGVRVGEATELTLFCRNCTDQHVPISLYDDNVEAFTGLASNLQAWDYNSVRTLGASASFKF